MGMAIIQVTPELLRQALHLPQGTKILGVDWQQWVCGGLVRLLVDHEELKDVPPGQPFPIIAPSFVARNNNPHPPCEIVFDSWNQQ